MFRFVFFRCTDALLPNSHAYTQPQEISTPDSPSKRWQVTWSERCYTTTRPHPVARLVTPFRVVCRPHHRCLLIQRRFYKQFVGTLQQQSSSHGYRPPHPPARPAPQHAVGRDDEGLLHQRRRPHRARSLSALRRRLAANHLGSGIAFSPLSHYILQARIKQQPCLPQIPSASPLRRRRDGCNPTKW